ncbi:MAG: Glutamate synthase [NADPH] large chain [Candidatus Methanosuratincola subterraneus]|uniref:Archaeal glutamate synthase [NADPH] n=1 Tax=Methanosuratincola subterraneus TaxID=2593994 RepID=A0A3S3VEB8_METS7|nr:MAG: Glutamate synthase [NADPH] large chain [Candidatus Methanosuratincola subterraneus]
MLENSLKEIDASRMSVRELNLALKGVTDGEHILIENPKGMHHIAAGLGSRCTVEIEGSVGYFAGTMINGPVIRIRGNAGWFLGDNITAGEIVVEGHSGNGTGQGLYGGRLVVKGDCGDRVGALMKNGLVVVGGDSGIMTGLYMMGGEIIALGRLGDNAGESMVGGKIFFSGPEPALGKNAKVEDASDAELENVERILRDYGLAAPKMRKIVPENPRYFRRSEGSIWNVRRERNRYRVEIDHGACEVCGVCARVCPQQVFKEVKQGYMAPINDFECVGCETCVEYCRQRAVRVYPVQETGKSTWSRREIDEIQIKAAIGRAPVRGMGAWKRFPHFDDLVFLCAQNSRPPIDHYREPCETEIVLGKGRAERPLRAAAPILVGAMSFGAMSKEAKLAVVMATSRVGIPTNTGEGGMLPEERGLASILIAQYASGRFGVSAEYLRSADAVEIKIGQGAKGGQGGLLMGEKVTEEVAKVRGLPPGSDAISPARHLDIVGPEDLKMKIEQLREITDWKVPIIVKYSAGRVGDDVKIAAKAGADVVVIDGKQGGTGAAPDIVIEHAGLPTLPALVEAERSLRELGMKDKVSLVVSGGIRNGADIAKAIALGADAVAISTGVLVAMGCRTCGLCSTGRCPRGITTQDPVLRKRLKVEEMAARVENYLRAIIEELKMFTQLSGKTSIRSLEKDDLRAITTDAAAITGVKLVGT